LACGLEASSKEKLPLFKLDTGLAAS